MLRSTTRRAPPALRRALSTAGGKSPSPTGAPATPDAVAAAAKKSSIGSSTLSAAASPSSSASATPSSGGSLLPKLLLLGVLTVPAGVAVYVNQNPTWNPEVLRGNENWIQFRELALGGKEKAAAATAGNKPKPAAPVAKTPVAPAKAPEELSQVITKGQKATAAAKKETAAAAAAPVTAAPAKKTEAAAPVAVEPKTKKTSNTTESFAQKVEKKKDEVVKAVVKAEQEAEKAGGEVVKTVVKAEQEIVKKGEEAAKKVIAAEQDAVKKVTAVVADAKHVIEKTIDEAALKAREDIDKLATEASAANLSHTVEKKVQATTVRTLLMIRDIVCCCYGRC